MADDVPVNLRFTATDDTTRVTQDMIRRAQEGARQLEASFSTRTRAIEAMAKRAGVSYEEMSKRVEKATKDSVRQQDEAAKRIVDALKKAAESQETFAKSTEKSTRVLQEQARVASRDMVSGMSAMGRATLENSRANDRLVAGMSQTNKAAKDGVASMGQQTSAISSATGALGRWAIGIVTATKVLGYLKDSYRAFAEQQRDLTRVGDAWQLNADQLKAYEEQNRKISAQMGLPYAELNRAAKEWAGTSGLVGDAQVKGWKAITDYAHAAGISIEDAAKLGNIAMTKLGVGVDDLEATFSGWLNSLPPAAHAAFAGMLAESLPAMKEMGTASKESGAIMAAQLKALIPLYGNADKAAAALKKTNELGQDPLSRWGKIMRKDVDEYNKGAITLNQLQEKQYQEAQRRGLYDPDRERRARARRREDIDPEILRTLEELHKKQPQVTEDTQKNIAAEKANIATKEQLKKLQEDELARLDRLSEARAKAEQETGKAEAPLVGAGIDIATDRLNRVTKEQAPGPAPGIGTRRTGRYRGGQSLGTPGGALPEITVTPRARGGEVDKDQPYLVGEEGPEVVVPKGGGQVMTAAQTEEAMRRGDVLAGQQAQADASLRQYLAGFRDKGRPMGRLSMLDARPGAMEALAGGGRAGGGGGGGGGGGDPARDPRAGTGPRGRDGTGTGDGKTGTPGVGDTPLNTPVGLDPASPTGPAESLEEAYKRGYLVPPGGGGGATYGLQDRGNKSIPASIRYNNPGAQWPSGEESKRFGQTDEGVIGGGNKIAGFPTPVHGLASNIALLNRRYVGKTVGAAIWEWSGHGRSSVPGFPSNAILTKEMALDPKFWMAMHGAESGQKGGLSMAQIGQSLAMYQAGSAAAYEKANPDFVAANKGKDAPGGPSAPGTTTAANLRKALEGGGGDSGKMSDQDKWIAERYNGHDWTWKDDQAATRAGMTRDQYVVGGMDPQLRQAMYEQGTKYEKETGKKFEFTSGFRDDYRQSLITSGVRAPVGYSHHGGSKIDLGGTAPGGMRNYGFGGGFDSTPEFGAWIKRQGSGTGIAWTGEHIGGDPYHVSGAWTREAAKFGLKMTPQQLAVLQERTKAAREREATTKVAGPAAVSDVETRAAARYKVAKERAAAPPAGPSFAQRARAGRTARAAAATPPAPVRRIPSAPGQEDRAAGKGPSAPAPVVRPVSPEGSEEKAAGKGLAVGGPADAGTPYMVGEQGPELFTPSSGGQVTSNTNLQAMMQSMREQMERPIEPIIRPKFQHMGASSARWTRHAERSREVDNSRRAARESHTDVGFA